VDLFPMMRSLDCRDTFKLARAAALADWRGFGVALRAPSLYVQGLVGILVTVTLGGPITVPCLATVLGKITGDANDTTILISAGFREFRFA
jgi:hypothetical protein